MRHLSLIAHVPTREELRVSIPRRERFQPEPILRQLPEVHPLPDGYAELTMRAGKRPRRIHPMHVAAIEALAARAPMAQIVERARPHCPPKHARHAERFTRKFLMDLAKAGFIEIPLEAPPAMFADRYEWVRQLGRGGMGIVHLCRDMQRQGALVVIKHAWGWSKPIEKAEQNVRQEARYLTLFDHPRIPKLLDAFEREGLLHIVEDFVEGDTLASVEPMLSERGSDHRLGVLRGCAEALAHVHERGYLYLDVKPGNFILGDAARGPTLLDFGLCRVLPPEGLRLRGSVGSPGYAAPEVVAGNLLTERTDVFSLGRSFAVLALDRPFKFKHKAADVRAALEAASHVTPAERDIISRMCADDAADRPASMREVLRALA